MVWCDPSIRDKTMYKILAAFFSILVSSLIFSSAVSAKVQEGPPDSEDAVEDGLYDDVTHPGVKVKVFVHKEKPVRSGGAPSLICDLADPNSTAVVSTTGWHLPSSVTYNLNLSSVPSSVGLSNLPTIAGNGFGDWAAASGNKVAFSRSANTTVDRSSFDLKNIVAWGRTSGTALGVTYVRYYSSSGLVVDVDTILNKKFSWSWSNSNTCADPNTYDAENILNHELGHWLGLDDQYNADLYKDATMFGYGAKGEVKKNTLTTGDTIGVYSIYNP